MSDDFQIVAKSTPELAAAIAIDYGLTHVCVFDPPHSPTPTFMHRTAVVDQGEFEGALHPAMVDRTGRGSRRSTFPSGIWE
jgi:hypothetical protein